MTIGTILIIIALVLGIAALLGVSSRVDLTAVAVVLLATALLLAHFS